MALRVGGLCRAVIFFYIFNTKETLCKQLGPIGKVINIDRIVGGEETTIQKVPYQVYLDPKFDVDFYSPCGGSILNSQSVLTAAHCLYNAQSVILRIASTYYQEGGHNYTSDDWITHPGFDVDTLDYNVAIIKLAEDMILDGVNAKAVKLPSPGAIIAVGSELLVAGWGTTSKNGNYSTSLLAVKLPLVSDQDCAKVMPDYYNSRMICAGIKEGGKDACQGDGGGAAVSIDTGEQFGISSFGSGCGLPEKPGFYVKVSEPSIHHFITRNL